MGASTKAGEEESHSGRERERRKEEEVEAEGVDESASLSFVVQMLLATVTAEEARDWWAGLNCKVHFRLMAVAARL